MVHLPAINPRHKACGLSRVLRLQPSMFVPTVMSPARRGPDLRRSSPQTRRTVGPSNSTPTPAENLHRHQAKSPKASHKSPNQGIHLLFACKKPWMAHLLGEPGDQRGLHVGLGAVRDSPLAEARLCLRSETRMIKVPSTITCDPVPVDIRASMCQMSSVASRKWVTGQSNLFPCLKRSSMPYLAQHEALDHVEPLVSKIGRQGEGQLRRDGLAQVLEHTGRDLCNTPSQQSGINKPSLPSS